MTATVLFWLCVGGLVYLYAGYPALMWVLSRWRPAPARSQRAESGARRAKTGNPGSGRSELSAPGSQHCAVPVSVVIVACNESRVIRRKLDSLFSADNSERIREVIVASDGSTDEIEAAVLGYTDRRVRLISFPRRRGKPAVLNDVVPQCKADIVVLTDARQPLHPQALDELAAGFADPSVGVVSGELVFRGAEGSTASQGIGFYWTYEKFIRRCESRFGSVPGATGALYTIRKHLFQPIDGRTLLDDVAIPMQAVVQGYRCLFEPQAVVFDTPSQTSRQESVRKRRTIAGNAQLLVQHPDWLLPWRNPIWLQWISHKVGRLLSPLLLTGAAVTNVLLVPHPLYSVLLSMQVCFYIAAGVGWAYQRLGARSSCFGPPLMFLALNLATAAALWDALRGRYTVTWRRAY